MGERIHVRGPVAEEPLGRIESTRGAALQRAISRKGIVLKRNPCFISEKCLTETLPCSSDLDPSQQNSTSGDLLPEMMESGTPPPSASPDKADDVEVSSQRIPSNLPEAEDDHM